MSPSADGSVVGYWFSLEFRVWVIVIVIGMMTAYCQLLLDAGYWLSVCAARGMQIASILTLVAVILPNDIFIKIIDFQ